MAISAGQRVTVSEKPLHGNQINLIDGSVVGVEAEFAKVILDGEATARQFPLSSIRSSVDGSHNDQIIDAIRRF